MIEISIQKTLQGQLGEMVLDIDVKTETNQITALYGSSGAGKTTFLKIISGLLLPENGKISVNGEVWLDTSRKFSLAPKYRKVAYVFQDYALFPNMSVAENIYFAAETRRATNELNGLIEAFELGELRSKKPNQLSGGQQQRVALARALAQHPKILLLDEPLSALDHTIRLRLQDYLIEAQRKYNLTAFLVSHDIAEINKLSKEVLVIEYGKILKQGTPLQVFSAANNDNKANLYGKIIALDKFNKQVIVLLNQETLRIDIKEEQLNELEIGALILLSFPAHSAQVKIN